MNPDEVRAVREELGPDAVDAQYSRIVEALEPARRTSRMMRSDPAYVTPEQKQQAFNAFADAGEWNRRHADRPIGELPALSLNP